MPYGHAIIAMRLLDYDQGDENDEGGVADDIMEYLSTRMTRFRFSDHSRKMDQVEMTFRNQDFSMFDKPAFVKGQKFLLTWGWPHRTAAPRRMVVKSVRGGSEIIVTARCTLSLMNKKKQARFMAGVTDSEWVKAIADEYRYTGSLVHIDPTEVAHDITQPRWMTDAQMMRKLAKRNGFDFYMDATGLHWEKPRTDRTPIKNYIYKVDPGVGDVLEPPSFDANLSRGITRVRVLARDPISKALVDESVGLDDEEDMSLGVQDELFDVNDEDAGKRGDRIGEELVIPGGLMTAAEARATASGMYRDTAKKRYKMKLKVVGDARVGGKHIIGLYGDVSQTMSGLYRVHEAVTEIMGGQFIQELDCRKDALQEVRAAKKRRPRKNVNPRAKAEKPVEPEEEMKMIITGITLPSGEIVAGKMWVDSSGEGISRQLTEEEFNALSQYEKEQLRYSLGAVSYPDA